MAETPTRTEPAGDERFKRVWDVIEGIPPGCVLNYGKVASLAGYPGKARMVGMALSRAPKQRKLPWHRVVNAQGKISFPDGSDKARTQRELLESEGVEFENDSIDLDRFSPERAIDRMLWGP